MATELHRASSVSLAFKNETENKIMRLRSAADNKKKDVIALVEDLISETGLKKLMGTSHAKLKRHFFAINSIWCHISVEKKRSQHVLWP